jgi:hypothetical protein
MHSHYDHPFPTGALGDLACPAVLVQSHANKLSEAMVGPIALGLCAAAIQDLYDVQRPNLARSSCSLFVAAIAGSGEGKDAAAGPFLAPFLQFQRDEDKKFAGLMRAHEVQRRAWKAQERLIERGLEKALADGDIPGANQHMSNLASHLEQKPALPSAPKVLFDDATVSAIKASLCDRWPSGLLYSMEGSDTFNGRLGSAFGFWNALWGGQPVFSDRVTEGARSCASPRFGMVIGIQPVPFRRFLVRRGVEAHDSGFTARYLLTFPPSTKGYRFIDTAPVCAASIDALANRISVLLNESAEFRRQGRERMVLRFTSRAASEFARIYNALQSLMAPHQPYASISGQAAKAAENIARIAAVLHVIDGLDGDIDEVTLHRAAVLGEWFTNQFLLGFSTLTANSSTEQEAEALEQGLMNARCCGHAAVRRSELQYWCPPDFRSTNLRRALHWLVRHGRANVTRHDGAEYISLNRGSYGLNHAQIGHG